MTVRGINLRTFLPIPLTVIPLTLDSLLKTVDRKSPRECHHFKWGGVQLTDFTNYLDNRKQDEDQAANHGFKKS